MNASQNTNNALIASGTVGISTGFGPHLVQPAMGWGFDIIGWIWPGIPLPDLNAQWSLATLFCGVVATVATYWLQQHAVNVAVVKTTELLNQQKE